MPLKKYRKTGVLICVLGMILWLTSGMFTIVSAGDIDGSLTLICRKDNVILEGMEWELYNVGTRQGAEFVLEGEFKDYPVSLKDFSAEGMSAAASTLENYAVLDRIEPLSSEKTNENGMLKFPNLNEGLYMVCGKTLRINDIFYVPSAILIEIREEADGSHGEIDFMAYPKLTYRVLAETDSKYTVKKIWENDENQNRETSITAEIYRDTELFDTVELNEANNWTYSWHTEDYAEWRVREVEVPPNYTVVYRSNETQYAIVNTYDDEIPPTEPTTESVTTATEITQTVITTSQITSETLTNTEVSETETATVTTVSPKLPQTGQLWWPVPIMGGSGLVLVVVGLRLNSKK